jgi:hypothetical protein
MTRAACVNNPGVSPSRATSQVVTEYVLTASVGTGGSRCKYARGSTTGIDWRPVTQAQMQAWNVRHHELIMGKPEADIFIDDKAFNADHWDWNNA